MFKKIAILLLINLLAFSKTSFASNRSLTVFTEPNMVLALTKIARLYSQRSNTVTSINFNSSADLVADIDSGEPSDVFISAHKGWIEALRQKGLVDVYNVGYIASDELALVTPKNNIKIPQELRSDKPYSLEYALRILDKNGATIIIDNEGSSSGNFSKNFLSRFEFSELKIFKKLLEDRTPFLNLIKKGNDNYAIILKSQIRSDDGLKVLTIKEDENIFYQALVIAGDNMEIAREFLKFLKNDDAKKILKESGFVIN